MPSPIAMPTSQLTGYQDIPLNQQTAVKLTPPPEVIPKEGEDPSVYRPSSTQALLQAQKGPIRVRFDGGAPTTTSGFLLAAGDSIVVQADIMRAARFVADTNAGPLLSVSYFA